MTPDNVWNQIHKDQVWDILPNGWFREFYDRHYKDSAGLTFLDLGCGAGAQTIFLADRGHTVLSLDIAQVALDRLKAHLTEDQAKNVITICGDASSCRLMPNSLDCVVEVSMFECLSLEDTMLVMWQIWRCLKPGGRLFARICAEDFPVEWMKKGTYHRVTSRDELLEMLRGFEGSAKIEETFIPAFVPAYPLKHWIVDAVKKMA